MPAAQLLATASAAASAPFCSSARFWYSLADVDHQGAHAEQHAAPDQDRDQHADRAAVVAAEQAQQRAGRPEIRFRMA